MNHYNEVTMLKYYLYLSKNIFAYSFVLVCHLYTVIYIPSLNVCKSEQDLTTLHPTVKSVKELTGAKEGLIY